MGSRSVDVDLFIRISRQEEVGFPTRVSKHEVLNRPPPPGALLRDKSH